VEAVTTDLAQADPPSIFRSMNVLKAEYLVARRLAYDGERRLDSAPYTQDSDDTGTYVDTLDLSIYGEPSAQLVLAQRATLDLLDKIAVAANDHFQSGVPPRKVTFAGYWRDHGSDEIRQPLPVPEHLTSAAVALAELAFDMDPLGLYPEAKALRHAGTHRLVNLTEGASTGITERAHSSIDASQLLHATRQSLRVARAAYLYLIDLVQDQEDELAQDPRKPSVPLPNQP
jgi:hypothetical protein